MANAVRSTASPQVDLLAPGRRRRLALTNALPCLRGHRGFAQGKLWLNPLRRARAWRTASPGGRGPLRSLYCEMCAVATACSNIVTSAFWMSVGVDAV